MSGLGVGMNMVGMRVLLSRACRPAIRSRGAHGGKDSAHDALGRRVCTLTREVGERDAKGGDVKGRHVGRQHKGH